MTLPSLTGAVMLCLAANPAGGADASVVWWLACLAMAITGRDLAQANAELEKHVAERTAQLEAVNRELEAFCFSVSHDLRAPLRTIRGFSEVLVERHSGQLDERGLEFLGRIIAASQRMDQLIQDLLKLSRLSRSELQLRDLDLSAMAREILGELEQGEPARRVGWRVAPELRARGDERLLRIALDNLLGNAWKFTSRQPEARIEVGGQPGPEPAFFVRDNGAGFDMAHADRLFGVFQRLHGMTEFPGHGVGLATVQRIVNKLGGRIWAEAAVGAGATFYFSLPAHENRPS